MLKTDVFPTQRLSLPICSEAFGSAIVCGGGAAAWPPHPPRQDCHPLGRTERGRHAERCRTPIGKQTGARKAPRGEKLSRLWAVNQAECSRGALIFQRRHKGPAAPLRYLSINPLRRIVQTASAAPADNCCADARARSGHARSQ